MSAVGLLPPPNLRPLVFERCFQRWVQSIVETVGAQVIPIDGKTLKGSYDREQNKSALHLVSAGASEYRLVLGQVKVADKPLRNHCNSYPIGVARPSAPLAVFLKRRRQRALAGCIITIDAMGTQTEIAAQIHQAAADYVLALKANHPTLLWQVKTWFEQALTLKFEGINFSYDERVETGHHRTEKRLVWTVPISQLPSLHQQADWVGLQTVVIVVRVRHLWNKTTREVQFYLTSLSSDACKLGQAIRLHWSVENCLHWTIDVTFKQDDCRVRTGHAPQNLALLRRIALNSLNP